VVVDSAGEVFGDAPNFAARVQSEAEPGTMFVTAAVRRQVAGLFVLEDKGPRELKGVPGSPILYRIVRPSGGGRRVGARTQRPLVGREDDVGILVKRWERTQTGAGQFIQIVGEPASASRGSLMNSAAGLPKRRTPGSNGRHRNCCRTQRSIRWWNGENSDLAARKSRRNRGLPTSNPR
jgi:hypothetical protein